MLVLKKIAVTSPIRAMEILFDNHTTNKVRPPKPSSIPPPNIKPPPALHLSRNSKDFRGALYSEEKIIIFWRKIKGIKIFFGAPRRCSMKIHQIVNEIVFIFIHLHFFPGFKTIHQCYQSKFSCV